jgi:archaellum component FlaF (FlaF/FlaG flagellin family)
MKTIQEYCKTNDAPNIISNPSFTSGFHKKTLAVVNGEKMLNFQYPNLNFRGSYSTETYIHPNSAIAKDILSDWFKSPKHFRYINRVTFTHPDFHPLKIDLSIVKSSTKERGRGIHTVKIEDSNVFQNVPDYEIELEVMNNLMFQMKNSDMLLDKIKQTIMAILSGLQQSYFPIPYSEQRDIQKDYLKLLYSGVRTYVKELTPRYRISPQDFIGPSSYTLQMYNLADDFETQKDVANIRKNFSVTEKADGIRHMLFINFEGYVYLINMSMNIKFTGMVTKNKSVWNTLIDGEYIETNKLHEYIYLFAAFDIYFINKKDVRGMGFISDDGKEDRYSLLIQTVDIMNLQPMVSSQNIYFYINYKTFYPVTKTNTIFDVCNEVFAKINGDLFIYEIDGLIFTPTNKGVGETDLGYEKINKQRKWSYSFKWKPPSFNTIDFLITTKKNDNNKDIVTKLYEDGTNPSSMLQIQQYKTLILRCGYNEKIDGYINPCNDILNDVSPSIDANPRGDYKPVQFVPTEPYDLDAGFCNILLKEIDTKLEMVTENGEIITDNSIVEFSYDLSLSGRWKWKPLRMRYDKTADLMAGHKNFGNSYMVANSNWYSIHNPVTEEMLKSSVDIPVLSQGIQTVYYNREYDSSNNTMDKGLRDFHNLYVKRKLIYNLSKPGDTLIDYSCGRGGDIPKWTDSKLSFVYGIDNSPDNINNKLDGVCSRYLDYKKIYSVPYALFVLGDSTLNIRNGEAMKNDKSKLINRAVFGNGTFNVEKIEPAIVRQIGKAQNGFDISSCQFSLHYFFETKYTLHNFIRNLSECTKLNGLFIGTCFDGKTVFNELKNKQIGDGVEIRENGIKLWEMVKLFSNTSFENDDTSIGYKISVFQHSIHKYIDEYLVNFTYFIQLMNSYGFELLTKDDVKTFKFQSSTGMFEDLYKLMKREINFDDSKLHYALNMTSNEKYISFLNRFFIFKKVNVVNSEELYNSYFLSDITQPVLEEPTVLQEPNEDLFSDLGREEDETSIPNILPEEEKDVVNEIVIDPDVEEPLQPPKQKTAVSRTPKEPKPVKEKVAREPKPVKEKVAKEPKPVKEKVAKEPKPVKERVAKEPKPVKERVAKEPRPVKEKVAKEPKPVKEKVAREPKTAKEPKEKKPRKTTTTRRVKKNDDDAGNKDDDAGNKDDDAGNKDDEKLNI